MNEVYKHHVAKEKAEIQVAQHRYDEMIAYMNCVHYHYDTGACEETCVLIHGAVREFCAERECWECESYKPKS